FSFNKNNGDDITRTYVVYFGSNIMSYLQGYFDVEIANATGIGEGKGLGGYVNGDVLTADPYIARVYLRYLIPLSSETSKVDRDIDQLPGNEPNERIEIRVGKYSTADVFDQNRYANNARTYFMNYSFITNPSYDYAGDPSGYSWGFAISYVQPSWQLTYGAMMVLRTTVNSSILDKDILRARGHNLALTL
ncbi:MAG: carbohydrate porin, partial [Nitrospirae bacterium]|nr:carbohydrate porin [Nitrospirota bacterium]